MRALGLLLCGIAASGCSFGANGAFACHDDSNCVGGPAQGRCEIDLGVCSFADSGCGSGYRFGDNSGAHSGMCVGAGDDIDGSVDSGGDSTTDAPPVDARMCFGGPHEICLTTLPTQTTTPPASIDTGVDANCDQIVPQPGGVALCVIAGTDVTVNTTRAYGTRPLVIVATGALTVTGTLDAGSHHTGANRTGAAANDAACSTAGNGEDDSGGAGGGGGGGFAGTGGTAGHGDTNNSGGSAGDSNGGAGGAVNTATLIRGGCRGGNGGDGANQGANGGDGGGAVYLIAGTAITINGGVFASGGGGFAGQGGENGGGGGGSGGLIGLDAPQISVTGTIAANGAGGGGGGSSQDGTEGTDGSTTSYNQRAAGGAGGNTNPPPDPNGGQGSATTNVNGDVSVGAAGGRGGGGGGIGVVWMHGTLTGAQISPSPTNI
ncbi:hypothetical protein BH11MYX2_BH11MYX2_23950 [soil metagenome]